MKETILCAAIWYKELDKLSPKWDSLLRPVNTDCGIVLCGYRHPHCMYQMIAITGNRSVEPECGKYVQGFLTNMNRFVDRKEGARIAFEAKQVNNRVSWENVDWETRDLYSEDLY